MRLANEVLAIARKETAVPIIQTDGDVSACIFIRNQLSVEPRDKPLHRPAILPEVELQCLSFCKLFGVSDTDSIHLPQNKRVHLIEKVESSAHFALTMKAFQLVGHGTPGRFELRDVADPTPAPDEVMIAVRACGLNRLDLWAEENGLPIKMELPRTLGGEISGEVIALGQEVKEHLVGDRVAVQSNVFCGECEFCLEGEESICLNGKLLGVQRDGGFAEMIAVPARLLVELPDEVSFECSAALTLAGSTAMHMLTKRTKVRQGDWVLVIGGASGVGSAAIQIAKQSGAYVISTGSTADKRAFAKNLGADHVVDSTAPDWSSDVRHITEKRGVDIVVEHVGGDVLMKSFECLARGGTVVTCGATTGKNVQINLWPFFVKQQSLVGSYGRNRQDIINTLDWAAQGKLKATVHQAFPLKHAAEAFHALRHRTVNGKVIVTP